VQIYFNLCIIPFTFISDMMLIMKTQYSFIIDFSFDGEKLTIFELGDFFTSSLDRLDKLRSEEGKAPLKEEYMAQLRSANPDAIYLDAEVFPSTSISFHDFSNNHYEKYRCHGGEITIEALLKYRGLLGQHQKLNRPVIASLHFLPSISTRATLATLTNDKFKLLNYPQGVLREAARDKTVFHAFTNESSLCPNTVLLDLRCDDILVNLNAFFEENKATHYVIKPTSLTQGMGVSIVTQAEAKILIQKLHRATRDCSIDVGFWSTIFAQANYFALLQTCVPSKEIIFENKPYRPTGRAVITATFNDEHALPVLTCLGGYWELPKESVKESFTTSSLVSPDGHYDDCIIIPIDPIDWCKINEEINHQLPSILLEMYTTPLALLEKKFNFSPAMQDYSGLEREIASLFKNLEYISFNVNLKSGYFQKAMIAYPGYVEEVKKIALPIQTVIQSKQSSKEPEKIPSSVETSLIRKNLIEYRGHEDSICLLSRYKPQFLEFFFFCSGILALGIGIETQRESLLAYGIFGILTGAYVKYVSLQENETKQHELCK
jgi:hypothetical protein